MSEIAGPADQTYAERLRGRRFWLPLIALAAATVAGVIALEGTRPNTAGPVKPATLTRVDPTIQHLVQRLEANRLFCGGPHAQSTTTMTCLFGAATTRTTIRVFPSHPALLATLKQLERTSVTTYTQTKAISYAVTGRLWMITGLWSQTGHYNETQTEDAQTAQAIGQQLNGCLELLPREAGSCAF